MNYFKYIFKILLPLMLIAQNAYSLDILGRDRSQGGQGVRRGLVAFYRFSNVINGNLVPESDVVDESGVGEPLNLRISANAGIAVRRVCDRSFFDPVSRQTVPVCYMDFDGNIAHGLRSLVPANKITSQCRSSNELTVEIFMRNERVDDLTRDNRMLPYKIITLARNQGVAPTSTNRYIGSSNDYNFFLGLDYRMATQLTGHFRLGERTRRNAQVNDGFRTGQTQIDRYEVMTSFDSLNSPDSQEQPILARDQLQQVVYTVQRDGSSRIYVSAAAEGSFGIEDPFKLRAVMRASKNRTDTNPFSGWADGFYLGIGNELTNNDGNAPIVATSPSTLRTEHRPWRGELYMVAIYCSAHTDEEILGSIAPNNTKKTYAINPAVTVTENHVRAAQLYTRITGERIALTAPIISGVTDPNYPSETYQKGMAQLVQEGNLYQAAQLATQHDGFFNITVRDFAKRMSTRDETVNTTLNDFVATVIGSVRDGLPATQLLTGNFFYMGDPSKMAAPSNILNDIVMSNNHYNRLEALNYNLRDVLMRVDRQYLSNGTALVDHPDPAGLLTTRAFMAAHAVGGTNRRIVEYAFRQFACIPITGWAFANGENRIGPDVDRFPGGDHNKFLSNCRSCHSNMDSLRGAFAKYHFNNNFTKHGDIVRNIASTEMNETTTTMCRSANGVACKMNRNNDVFPQGYETVDDSFLRPEFVGSNAQYFGWTNGISSNGARGFGQMMTTTKAFQNCMTARAFRAVCKREPTSLEKQSLESVAEAFKNDNYNLRNLFARVAVTNACMGSGSGQ